MKSEEEVRQKIKEIETGRDYELNNFEMNSWDRHEALRDAETELNILKWVLENRRV